MDGGRLLLMLGLGFLFLEVAMTGKLGSIIGSLILPANMQAASGTTSSGQGA